MAEPGFAGLDTFTYKVRDSVGAWSANAVVKVFVVPAVDIDIENKPEQSELNPGAWVVRNDGTNKPLRVKMIVQPIPAGWTHDGYPVDRVVMTTTGPHTNLFTIMGAQVTIPPGGLVIPASDLPKDFYVEGDAWSDWMMDVMFWVDAASSMYFQEPNGVLALPADCVSFTTLWVEPLTLRDAGEVSPDNAKDSVQINFPDFLNPGRVYCESRPSCAGPKEGWHGSICR